MASISSKTRMSIADPIVLQRLEGLIAFIVGVSIYSWLGQPWLVFGLLFLAPDIFMLGFLQSQRTGMLTYNLAHTFVAPALVALLAALVGPFAYGLAAIWVAHIGFDRMLGFGLKLGTSFGETHLGTLGKGGR